MRRTCGLQPRAICQPLAQYPVAGLSQVESKDEGKKGAVEQLHGRAAQVLDPAGGVSNRGGAGGGAEGALARPEDGHLDLAPRDAALAERDERQDQGSARNDRIATLLIKASSEASLVSLGKNCAATINVKHLDHSSKVKASLQNQRDCKNQKQ